MVLLIANLSLNQTLLTFLLCVVMRQTWMTQLILAISPWEVPTRKLCIHFVYKNCTRCMQLMYTKWMQNVYHISTNLCIHFVYKIKRTMPAKFCIQNLYKSLLKCGIHFVYEHFVYILYTSILMYKIHTFIYK